MNFFALAPTSGRAGRKTSRTGRSDVATLKTTTPMLTTEQQPLKPATPVYPITAPKTPVSRPQRRSRFQSHAGTHEQRQWRYQTTMLSVLHGQSAAPVGGGRARAGLEIDHSEPSSRVAISRAGRRPPAHTAARPSKHNEAARPHRGPGGSRIRPLGGSQRLFQRICVPAEPRRWQASTTRAAMPASADLPHVRGSYCFLMPTSPSIFRTPS